MKIYSVGVRGGLKKISKADFKEDDVYLIEDSKTIYLWFGTNVTKNRKDISLNKAEIVSKRKESAVSIQTINQNKEYGAFIAIKESLRKGEIKKQHLRRRPELEIQFEETLELIEAGISPDLEAEITLAAHKLSQERKSYKTLCRILARMQLDLLKGTNKATKNDIQKKAQEIFESSSTYEEICWLIAQLNVISNKHSKDS